MNRRVVVGLVGIVLGGVAGTCQAQNAASRDPSAPYSVGMAPIPSISDSINNTTVFSSVVPLAPSTVPSSPVGPGQDARFPKTPVSPNPISMTPIEPIHQSIKRGFGSGAFGSMFRKSADLPSAPVLRVAPRVEPAPKYDRAMVPSIWSDPPRDPVTGGRPAPFAGRAPEAPRAQADPPAGPRTSRPAPFAGERPRAARPQATAANAPAYRPAEIPTATAAAAATTAPSPEPVVAASVPAREPVVAVPVSDSAPPAPLVPVSDSAPPAPLVPEPAPTTAPATPEPVVPAPVVPEAAPAPNPATPEPAVPAPTAPDSLPAIPGPLPATPDGLPGLPDPLPSTPAPLPSAPESTPPTSPAGLPSPPVLEPGSAPTPVPEPLKPLESVPSSTPPAPEAPAPAEPSAFPATPLPDAPLLPSPTPAPAPPPAPAPAAASASTVDPNVSRTSQDEVALLTKPIKPRALPYASMRAAAIGDEIITINELERALNDELKARTGGRLGELDQGEGMRLVNQVKFDILNRMIDQALVIQEAKRKMQKNPKAKEAFDAEIDKEWKAKELPLLLSKTASTNVHELKVKLTAEGKSYEGMKDQYRKNMMFHEFLRAEIHNKVTADMSELKVYYRDHLDTFEQPARMTWREIEVNMAKYPSRAAARQKAEESLARLLHDEEFEAVARSVSNGPTASKGGLYVDMTPGSYGIPVVNDELNRLPVGQVSQILEAPGSFHIIRVDSRRDKGPLRFDEVQDKVRTLVINQNAQKAVEEYLGKLRAKTLIRTMFDNNADPALARRTAASAN